MNNMENMNKITAASSLRDIGNLLQIEGENSFKARAYIVAAESLLASALPMDKILANPTSLPGIGHDIAEILHRLSSSGLDAVLAHANITIPRTAADLLRVPGIGPKTANRLVHAHGIVSLPDLARALESGKLEKVSGFGRDRMDRLKRDVAVLVESLHAIPIARLWPLATQLAEEIRAVPGVQSVAVTGDARRLVVMCPHAELVVAVDDEEPIQEWYAERDGTEEDNYTILRVVSPNETVPVRIHTVPVEAFAPHLMRTTGDGVHQDVIEGLLRKKGIVWAVDRLTGEGGETIQVPKEVDIYRLIGMPFLPPEVREGQGILVQPDELVQREDIRGDLHVHSNWSDGSMSIEEVASHAARLGYSYIAITDHSQSLSIAHGLTPERVREQRGEIERVRRLTDVKILHGTEVDILSDGQLDLPDDVLWDLDIVVASVHSTMQQSKTQMTERIIKAIRHPAVDIIGHLTGRVIGRRFGYEVDMERILEEAYKHGVVIELNANAHRLDVSESALRQAQEMGILISIDTDTHHEDEFDMMEYGIRMAKRGWLKKTNVLNTLPYDELVGRLHRDRRTR
ncbi:PHP domain-containing protein [Alicyclobacillus dauci]|uniref:DNA-directed DNA polymerase n=1 Tax=Alicyclobacillus dauci TaxID=1475485 RepID=A0ABY6Z216_9BACL|nr:PHP domain-containing protein [Alicyclobacillus dauci]WAH36934.1 PHP domain-containing protein [Alicyclobacillus dauci]